MAILNLKDLNKLFYLVKTHVTQGLKESFA